MEKITLTTAQAEQLEPLTKQAYATGGTVFSQVQRAAFPNHETFVVSCHYIPPESSKRLRAFLTKEAQRIAPKAPMTQEETV